MVEFLSLHTSDIWGQIVLCCRELSCALHMFIGIPGLYSSDANRNSLTLHWISLL